MTPLHLFFVVAINLIWGSMFVVATIALREFPPMLFTGVRFGILALMLAPFLLVPRRLIGPLLQVGLLMGVGMYLTLYLSLFLAENTAAVALFSKLEVPFALLLGVLFLGENIGPRRITGVAIALVGAAVISFDPAAFDNLPALFWIAVSSFFGAATMIQVRRLPPMHPLTITGWVALVSAPVMILISVLFETGQFEALSKASWNGWAALFYTVVMGSIISHTGFYFLLQRYPVSTVVPYTLLSPVFGVIGGVAFLDDLLTTELIAGGLLILFGVGWIHQRAAAQAATSKDENPATTPRAAPPSPPT